MITLSDQYAAATTEAQRSQILAAGQATIAADMWHSTGAYMSGILLQSGLVLISVIMLRSPVFGRTIAFVGILTHGLDLAHVIANATLPGNPGDILMIMAGPLYPVWFILLGLSLLRLGRLDRKPLLQPA